MGREYDLDLSLLLHLKFLDRVHTQFYKEYDSKGASADIKPVIRQCFDTIMPPTYLALLQVLYKGKAFSDNKEVRKTYEGAMCRQLGLRFEAYFDVEPKEGMKQWMLVPDSLTKEA